MPRLLARAHAWLRAAFARRTVEDEMQQEMAQHLARTVDRLMGRGLTPEAARIQARREFGNLGVIQEQARDVRGARWLAELTDDVRYSTRALARAPGFTILAALILALGIGTSTAVFTAIDAVLLAPLPYPRDEQLLRIYEQNSPTNRWTLSEADYRAMEQFAHTLIAVGVVRPSAVVVSAGASSERMSAGYATAGFFEALGVTPAVGRRLTRDDERPDAPGVALVSHRFAAHAFGSAANALDHVIDVDGWPHHIVGVLAPGVTKLSAVTADVWPVLHRATPTRRGPFGLYAIARMRSGVSLLAAQRDLAAVSARLFLEWRASFQDSTARLTPYPLRETITGRAARPLTLFSAAVALVLLIAIANVASLSIVRGMRRWRELALRAVLGASRARLLRLVITESVVLSVIGAALGLAVAWGGLALLQQIASDMPRLGEARIGARAVLLTLGVALAAGVAIGFVPATRLLAGARYDVRDGSRAIGDSKRGEGIRAFFVATEFALALPILAAGALLLTSFMRLSHVDPGIDARGVVVAKVSVPSASYKDDSTRGRFWAALMDNMRQGIGTRDVALSTALPPDDDGNNNDNFDLVDSPVPPGGAQPTVTWPAVSRDFFTALGLRLAEGRSFMPNDTGAPPVAVVTRSWAKRYYPGRSAIGREIIRGGCTSCPHTVVVGIVSDAAFDGLGMSREVVFSPLSEGWPREAYLFLRTRSGPPAVQAEVRHAVQAVDPSAAVGSVTLLESDIYDSIAQPRHWAIVLIAFAGSALLLAAVGIFGLLSYTVALRRREIGVRMALGAPEAKVLGWLVAGGLRLAILGSLVGLGLTVVASRWLRASLYEVSAVDPLTLVAVSAGLIGVGALACWLPARQAASIDPVEAMRPD